MGQKCDVAEATSHAVSMWVQVSLVLEEPAAARLSDDGCL
jgi:hypothetical protein